MVRAYGLTALALSALVGCGSEECGWETGPEQPVAFHTEPTLVLTCNGSDEPTVQQLAGFYDTPRDVTINARPGVTLQAADASFVTQIFFDAALPDGSYDLASSPGIEVWAGTASGTFAFRRSRDVPFIDVPHPDEGKHESFIEVDFDLTLRNRSMPCRLTTGPQHARFVKRGDLEICPPQRSHPG
jgi:hypothetical protein